MTRSLPSDGLSAVDDNSIAEILNVLRQGKKFLLCSHAQPDGDAVGSMLALGMVLQQMGKRADLVTADRIPADYRQLPGVDQVHVTQRVEGAYDAVILLDCHSLQRTKLQGLEDFFQINIDHHLSGQDFAHLNWIDREAVSVGEMVYRLARAVGARRIRNSRLVFMSPYLLTPEDSATDRFANPPLHWRTNWSWQEPTPSLSRNMCIFPHLHRNFTCLEQRSADSGMRGAWPGFG